MKPQTTELFKTWIKTDVIIQLRTILMSWSVNSTIKWIQKVMIQFAKVSFQLMNWLVCINEPSENKLTSRKLFNFSSAWLFILYFFSEFWGNQGNGFVQLRNSNNENFHHACIIQSFLNVALLDFNDYKMHKRGQYTWMI